MPWRGPEVKGEFPTLGYVAADWIESTLPITDGPNIGQPVRLYDEQLTHLLHKYRLNPKAKADDGNDAFQYGGSMLVRGQKWGKDPLLAMIDLFHAFGPCDFSGWDANGEPVGREHPSPWVGVAALNDLQANNTWLPLKAMVEGSMLGDLSGVEVNLDLIRLPCGNPIERLTTTAFGRLGGRFTKVSLTENGLMTDTVKTGAAGGQRSPLAFAQTLIRSVDGMGGMWTAATNTWDPTERSHAQRVFDAKDPHTHVDAKLSRKRVDLDDDEALTDEIRYLYGDSLRSAGGHVSEQRIIRAVRDKSKAESDVRRFFLSEVLAGERPFVTPERWTALADSSDPLVPGEGITLGFDGSRSRDATVLTACRVRDGRLFHLRTWIPADCPGGIIPRTEVDQAVRDLFAVYKVWFLYADPYRWQDYLDVWAAAFPGKVVEQPTNVETRMDAMIERFTTAAREGELSHSGDATLTMHVQNAVIAKGRRKPSKPREDDDGVIVEHYLKLVKKREGLLIDVAIAALLAYEARGQAVEDGALTTKTAPSPVSLSSASPATAGRDFDPATAGF